MRDIRGIKGFIQENGIVGRGKVRFHKSFIGPDLSPYNIA